MSTRPLRTFVLVLLVLVSSASTVHAQCAFSHTGAADTFESGFVASFFGCAGDYSHFPGNDMTEGGLESCSPPSTYTEGSGSPLNGWSWDEFFGSASTGSASIRLSRTRNRLVSALNPPGDTKDVRVRLRMSGVRDQDGPANGIGTLSALATMTLRDRRGTATESDDTPMTLADLRFESAFTLTDGEADLDTSVDAMLNAIGQPGLPHCSSLEFFAIELADQNGTTFAQLGTWLSP